MTIQLTPQAEERIQKLIESGRYDDPAAVVDQALELLEERDQRERLRAALTVGDEQYARGQVTTWTPDFLNRLKREAEEDDRLGVPIRDDVQP